MRLVLVLLLLVVIVRRIDVVVDVVRIELGYGYYWMVERFYCVWVVGYCWYV